MNLVEDTSAADIAAALDRVGARFILGDEDWVLGPGEVASFDTKVPHWLGSTGDEPAEILSIFERSGERMTVRTTSP